MDRETFQQFLLQSDFTVLVEPNNAYTILDPLTPEVVAVVRPHFKRLKVSKFRLGSVSHLYQEGKSFFQIKFDAENEMQGAWGKIRLEQSAGDQNEGNLIQCRIQCHRELRQINFS